MSRRAQAPGIRDRHAADPRPRGKVTSQGLFPGGSYDGARSDLRELAEWSPSAGGPHGDILGDLPALRARSRDLVRNSPIAGSGRQTTVLGVVGTGLALQPRIDRAFLKLPDADANAFEEQARRCFWAFAYGTPCDTERRHMFDITTRKILASAWENGDAFVVRRGVQRPRDLLALKLQLLEADRCSTPADQTSNPLFYDGVELEKGGAIAAYHFASEHPGEMFRRQYVRKWDRVPAYDAQGERLVLHVTNPVTEARIGALRGVPALATAIKLFKQIDRYTTAEIMAAVVSAMFTVFIKTAAGSPNPGLAKIDPNDLNTPDTQFRLDTGAIIELMEGQEATFADPSRPNANFGPFVQSMLEQVGTSLGIPHEVLMRSFKASYSASRAAIEMAWAAFRMMRSWFIDEFAQPVYEWVLVESILRGALIAPGFFEDPLVRLAYSSAEWVGPTAPQVDPLKEAQAAKARIDARLSTHQREASLITGADWSETIEQLGKEHARMTELGLAKEDVAERIVTEPVTPIKAPDDGDDSDLETDEDGAGAPTPPGQED